MSTELPVLLFVVVPGLLQGCKSRYRVEVIVSLCIAVPICLLVASCAVFGLAQPGKELFLYLMCGAYITSILAGRAYVEVRYPQYRRMVAETPMDRYLQDLKERIAAIGTN